MAIYRVMLVAAASFALAAPPTFAQSATSPSAQVAAPAFDVASIRENKSIGGRHHIYSASNDGNFGTVNAPLMMILKFAYGIQDTQIVDSPSWLDSVKFDIEAKAGSSVDDQMRSLTSDQGKLQKQQMVKNLLADRFQLTAHPETRELPAYDLVVTQSGPKLHASEANGNLVSASNGHITTQGRGSVASLAEELARALGRVVIDKTGLDGRYDINLQWTPDDATPVGSSPPPDSPPDIFTAVQEQLGLKLEFTKSPVPVLVVDHVAMPSEN